MDLNRRLLSGSHDIDYLPQSFSRVLSAYAVALNNTMPSDRRQSMLTPLIARLAGTADTEEIEQQRYDFILLGMVRTVLPTVLRGWRDDLAAECAVVTGHDAAVAVVAKIGAAVSNVALTHTYASALAHAVTHAHTRALTRALAHAHARALTRALASALAGASTYDDLADAIIFDLAHDVALDLDAASDFDAARVALLDGAMKIGNHR